MKKIWDFFRSNKLAVCCIAACIFIGTIAAGGKIWRQKYYIEDFSSQLSNAAVSIDHMMASTDVNGNVKREFLLLRDCLLFLEAEQYAAHYYVDRRFLLLDSFHFIRVGVCDLTPKEGFLSEGEIEFLKEFRTDLQNLANELDGYRDSFLFVDIKAVNRLLEEFDRKYGGSTNSLKTIYKDVMDINFH